MLSLEPASGSLYMMMPGCQEFFRHQVPANRTRCNARFSLSFRRMFPHDTDTDKTITNHVTVSDQSSSPVKQLVSKFEGKASVVNGTKHIDTSLNTHHKINPNSITHKNSPKTPKRTTVLFGTSMTLNVDGNRLAYGGRKCVNVSESGAKISDISRMVEHFYFTHPSSNDVDKIIFSFGTNDIKYQRNGVYKFKKLILNLIHKTKELYPHAIIFIQSVLPMKLQFYYTANNFLTFNRLLIELCRSERCSFIDCFFDFISGNDYNRLLYKDHLHLNKRGLGLLCRWLKHAINHQTFNPYVY